MRNVELLDCSSGGFRRTVLESLPHLFHPLFWHARLRDRCHHLNNHPLRIFCTTSLCCYKQVDPYDTCAKCSLRIYNGLRMIKFKNTESLLRLCYRHFQSYSAFSGTKRQMALVIIKAKNYMPRFPISSGAPCALASLFTSVQYCLEMLFHYIVTSSYKPVQTISLHIRRSMFLQRQAVRS